MRFSVVVVLGTLAATEIRAEVPPLDAKKLDAEAALVVTGVVMYVDVGAGTSRLDGVEYPYDLTVRVSRAKKGDAAPGSTLIARGKSIELKRGYRGSTGHYALDTWDRITAVQPGWEVTLYLKPPVAGIHEIVFPNGFAILARPPSKSFRGSAHLEAWVIAAISGSAAAFLACIYLCRWQMRKHTQFGASPDRIK